MKGHTEEEISASEKISPINAVQPFRLICCSRLLSGFLSKKLQEIFQVSACGWFHLVNMFFFFFSPLHKLKQTPSPRVLNRQGVNLLLFWRMRCLYCRNVWNLTGMKTRLSEMPCKGMKKWEVDDLDRFAWVVCNSGVVLSPALTCYSCMQD